MHLLLPADVKAYIDLIKYDSDIYKTASTQDRKPWGDSLSASNISTISKNTCLVPSGLSWELTEHKKKKKTSTSRLRGFQWVVCVAEGESLFSVGCCLSHVTGEGNAQLDVSLSRDQPVPLVSVLSGLPKSLQEKHAWLVSSCHCRAAGLGGECSLALPSAPHFPSSWVTSEEKTHKSNLNISVQTKHERLNEHCPRAVCPLLCIHIWYLE